MAQIASSGSYCVLPFRDCVRRELYGQAVCGGTMTRDARYCQDAGDSVRAGYRPQLRKAEVVGATYDFGSPWP